MAPHRPSFRIAMPSFLLALALVSGAAAPAIARDATGSPRGVIGGPHGVMDGAEVRTAPRTPAAWRQDEPARSVAPPDGPEAEVRPPTPDLPKARPVTVAKASARVATPPSTTGRANATSHSGRNHVWIPSLGVNRSISFFSCSSQAYPGNRVYRWGCAGSNNIYLFGHAGSVFAPLHDAYVAGRLQKGMAVYYANDAGVVHRYTVRWWKVTTPDDGAWAYASQATPSLTLQTCIGARSQYRLIVRLVQSD
jgi:sortase (surface protein transpeptidase)